MELPLRPDEPKDCGQRLADPGKGFLEPLVRAFLARERLLDTKLSKPTRAPVAPGVTPK
jgi:hypothetical protein